MKTGENQNAFIKLLNVELLQGKCYIQNNNTIKGIETNYMNDLSIDDFIIINKSKKRIININDNTITIQSTNELLGTISINNSATIIGLNTDFTKSLNKNIYVKIENIDTIYKIEHVISDTEIILNNIINENISNRKIYKYVAFNDDEITDINNLSLIYKVVNPYCSSGKYISLVNSNIDNTYSIINKYNNIVELNINNFNEEHLLSIYNHKSINNSNTNITINILPNLSKDINNKELLLKKIDILNIPNIYTKNILTLDTVGPYIKIESLDNLTIGGVSNITPVKFKIKMVNSKTNNTPTLVKGFNVNDIILSKKFKLEELNNIKQVSNVPFLSVSTYQVSIIPLLS